MTLLHTIVDKLMLLCKGARSNILTGSEFITTRVRDTDKDNDKKLGRIIKYLSGMRDLVITLGSDGTGTVKLWVDAAFAVHHDTKIHTVGMMSVGKGALYSASNKQKLKTKSLTEADLAGINDLMPQI